MSRARRSRDEQGETLLELVVAITILGVCVVAIASGVVLSIKMSRIHRDQSTAGAFLHNYAEAIQGSYATCSSGVAPNYVSVAALAAPTGFNTPTASVKFWDANTASFTSGSCPSTDPGLQQVTLTLTSSDGFVSESLVTVVRKTS